MSNVLKIYTDGGARGNPGPAASAFVAIIDGNIIHKDSTFLGVGTNNQAEYKAVILAYEWLTKNQKQFKGGIINFFLDSELVTKQLEGLYKVKDEVLKKLFQNVKDLQNSIETKIEYTAIRREKNKLADSLVNETLDKIQNKI